MLLESLLVDDLVHPLLLLGSSPPGLNILIRNNHDPAKLSITHGSPTHELYGMLDRGSDEFGVQGIVLS